MNQQELNSTLSTIYDTGFADCKLGLTQDKPSATAQRAHMDVMNHFKRLSQTIANQQSRINELEQQLSDISK